MKEKNNRRRVMLHPEATDELQSIADFVEPRLCSAIISRPSMKEQVLPTSKFDKYDTAVRVNDLVPIRSATRVQALPPRSETPSAFS